MILLRPPWPKLMRMAKGPYLFHDVRRPAQ